MKKLYTIMFRALPACLVLLFIQVIPLCGFGQTLVTYPEPAPSFEKESDLYLVSVSCGDSTKSSYVYVSRAGTDTAWEWQGNEGKSFHFTTFSFSGTATVSVTKLGSTATSATLRPDRAGLGTVATSTVTGGKMISFTLSGPKKISVEFNDDPGLRKALMIFADTLELPADQPDPEAANVFSVNPLDTLIVPSGKTIVYFGPGVYNIHYWRVPETVTQVYISGGAYVRGYIGANRTTAGPLKVNGRGIISNDLWSFHYPEVADPHNPVSTGWYKSLVLSGGKKHIVEGITMIDGTSFNLVLAGDSCQARNLKIHGFRYNNDAITVAGAQVTIRDCFIRVGDDGIVANGSRDYDIQQCVFWHLRGGSCIQLGWRPHNINGTNLIADCDVIHAEWVLPQTQNSGFLNYMGDGAGNSNVTMENFTVKDIYFDTEVLKLIDIRMNRGGTVYPLNVKNFLFKNIHAKIPSGHTSYSIYFNGKDTGNKVSGMRFNEFYINDVLLTTANHAALGHCRVTTYADPLIFFDYVNLSSQIFQQDFNASSSLSTYMSTTPDSGQFDSVGTTGPGTVVSVTGNKLVFDRTANADYGFFARPTDFIPTPGVIQYAFNLAVSGNNTGTTQNQAAVFQTGKGFVKGNNALTGTPLENNALLHSRLGISFGATPGQFAIRDISAAVNSGFFSGTQRIAWVMNNSTKTVSYVAPDGTDELLASDRWDAWVGTTKIFNERLSNGAADVVLTDLKFAFLTGIGVIEFDSVSITAPTGSSLFGGLSVYNAPATSGRISHQSPEKDAKKFAVSIPDHQTLQVSVSSGLNEMATLQVLSLDGRRLFSTSLQLTKGVNNFKIPGAQLAPGINIVVLSGSTGKLSRKIFR
jgi:hypothetical protein